MKPKIRWVKADFDLYSCILDEKLPLLLNITPSCDIDVDLLAVTLNSILYSASLAASPKGRPQSKQRKKTLPVWNISYVVEASKNAHRVWQMAGAPCDPPNPLVVRRKMTRRHMRRTIRQQSYLHTQEKYEEIMQAKVEDTKLFYRLIIKQISCIKTATGVLHYDGKSFSSSVDVAEHFQQLATPSNNPLFDAEYENQVTFDRLLIESIALQQEGTIESVTLNEVNTIVKSFKSNEAQDSFGISAEHLKHAPRILLRVLTALINRILHSGYIPSLLKQGILTPALKKEEMCYFTNKLQRYHRLIYTWKGS